MPRQYKAVLPQTRRDGFAKQKLLVLPEGVVRGALNIPLLRGLVPVAAGFFPAAERHFVERTQPLPEAIVILCISGRGWVQVGHALRQVVEPDAFVFIAPGETHAYGADSFAPWSIHWAHIRGDEVPEFFKLFGATQKNPVIHLPQGAAERVDFGGIYARLEEDYTVPNLMSAAMRLRMLFTELNRFRMRHDARESKADPIERTIVWMREHIHERVELSTLARNAGLSAAHYSTVFRGKTGYSPVDYFLRMKVQHACRLLDTTPMRVDEIAASTGYEDPFYFSRLFRRIMNKSPRAYRAATKG